MKKKKNSVLIEILEEKKNQNTYQGIKCSLSYMICYYLQFSQLFVFSITIIIINILS